MVRGSLRSWPSRAARPPAIGCGQRPRHVDLASSLRALGRDGEGVIIGSEGRFASVYSCRDLSKRRVLFVIAALLALPACRRGGGVPGAAPVTEEPSLPPVEARVTLEEMRARQLFAAQNVVLYPKRLANPYVYAALDLANGKDIDASALPVDYWRWPLVWYLAREGKMDRDGAREWFRQWVKLEATQWQWSWPYGSLNHQLARSGGLYAALLVLGDEKAKATGSAAVLRSRERIRDVLNGQWWDEAGPWEGQRTPPAGSHPETTRSRHYAPRDWTFLWAIADLGDAEESAIATRELDVAWKTLRAGLRPDGLWDETRLPRHRANKDQTFFPEGWQPFGLTCHPSQTPVLSYVLFQDVPWRPEFQGHANRRDGDERHEQWSDYVFVGGLRWRPLRTTAAP